MSDIRGPMRPWLRIVLFASLALNLAVAGMFAGFLLKGPPRHGHDRDPVAPYTRAFDEEQRGEVWQTLRQRYRADRAADGRPDVLGEYRAALDALRAEPFDAEGFGRVLAEQGARADERRQRGETVLLDYVTALSPEDRAAYADRLEVVLEDYAARFERFRKKGGRD